METYQQFINGALVDSHSSDFIEVENPYTNQIIGRAPKGDVEDANRALEAAKRAQGPWSKTSAAYRAGYLKQFAQLIRSRRVELAHLLASEQAKVLPLAQVEIDFTADYFDYYAGWAMIYEGEVINSGDPRENIWLFQKPIGVVAGICPWNFPFFVMARKVAPALLTGCAIVIKPSSTTPLTTFEFARLVATLDLPAGVLNFVSGGGATLGNALVTHPYTDMVSLTGSVEAGQEVIKGSVDKVMKTSLELGGKAPAVVFPDADLDIAVKGVTDSRLIYSGQVCNCCERAYVHRDIYDEFVSRLTASFQAAAYGDPFADPAPVYSSQIDQAQLDKIEGMVARATAAGAQVVTGGQRADLGTGYFFQPTILAGAKQDSEIVQKEVFGPVLPIIPWDDYDQVMAWANDCEYGLTSSVFSTNVNTVMQAIKDLNFGETYVNREHFEGLQGFHAGWRKSGIGGADGKHGLYEYLQSQVVYLRY
ncbi:MAG: aldehyde dehydrogenase [Propionibacteriaceae bacterium]|jgi:lactaldehyde dehydrogenase/glycolaldehyde dehydrogenase|nr:aldehyde dehydrogenase [Propionibacteriaceae bacterium]